MEYGKMKVLNIEELNLNDSCVHEIVIRSGEICFKIDYIQNYESDAVSKQLLVFKGCRSVSSMINLDVAWPDSMQEATETRDGEWRKIVLEMNTSASVFKITCREVLLVPDNSSGCIECC